MKYCITLPCFPGFYESWLYCPDMEADAVRMIAENVYPYTFPADVFNTYLNTAPEKLSYTLDFPEYQKEIARRFCYAVEDALSDALYRKQCVFTGISIQFEAIHSPREYNFTTDKVEAEIEIDPPAVLAYLEKNRAAWEKYLSDTFSSRPGFLSFYSPADPAFNDPETWPEDSVYLSAALEFILLNDLGEDAAYFLSEKALADCPLVNYIKLAPAVDEFIQSAAGDALTAEYNRLALQGSRYLEIMGNKYRPAVIKGMDRITKELAAEMLSGVEALAMEV